MVPLKGSTLVPAPGRGQYDRALGRARRQAEQRERLLLAVAEAFALEGRSVSLSTVVERAGTGRNTFYEYFDDVEHALVALRARSVNRLEGALAAAITPTRTRMERLRAISVAYFETLAERPYEAAVGLWREAVTDALSPLGRALCSAYLRAVGAGRAAPDVARLTRDVARLTPDDEWRALSVAAAAEALFGESILAPLLSQARAEELNPASSAAQEGAESRAGSRGDIGRAVASDVPMKEGLTSELVRGNIASPLVKESAASGFVRGNAASAPAEILVELAIRVLR